MHQESETLILGRKGYDGLYGCPGRYFSAPDSIKKRTHPIMSLGSNKIRILLVDDHAIMRVGLSEVIRREPDMEVVAEAKDGIEAMQAYRMHTPDIVIMDLRMPRQGGVETICILREEYKDARILVYSNSTNQEQIHASFTGGASGFVSKNMPLEDLLKAIRSIYQGVYYVPPEILARIGYSATLNLTAREMMVLHLVAKGMSNKEIGVMLHLAECAVKVHITSILAKMEVSDRNQAVLVAVRRGILQIV